MNIQNIVSLTETLKKVGLKESVGQQLLQHICFKPSEFSIMARINKEKDLLFCVISFQRNGGEYACNYYDVSLMKNLEIPDRLIQSVNIKDLDARMSHIDWFVSRKSVKPLILEDESTWEEEKNIERIVTDLAQLSSNEDGSYFAEYLKVKHWSGCSTNSLVGNLNALRSRFEISQRFYFIEGQNISVEEGYRFLLNRWMEKQQSLKRKQRNNTSEESFSDEGGNNARTALPKHRKNRKKTLK